MNEDRHGQPNLTRHEPVDPASRTGRSALLSWGEPIHRHHAGRTLDHPQPVLLDRTWHYEPASCLTGFRVVAQIVAAGVFVCPLCGLRVSS